MGVEELFCIQVMLSIVLLCCHGCRRRVFRHLPLSTVLCIPIPGYVQKSISGWLLSSFPRNASPRPRRISMRWGSCSLVYQPGGIAVVAGNGTMGCFCFHSGTVSDKTGSREAERAKSLGNRIVSAHRHHNSLQAQTKRPPFISARWQPCRRSTLCSYTIPAFVSKAD